MFESAEIGHKMSKGEYKRIEPALRAELLDAQYQLLKDARVPVIVLISGVRGAGKGETVNLLNEWMDPRLIQVSTFDVQTDEELAKLPKVLTTHTEQLLGNDPNAPPIQVWTFDTAPQVIAVPRLK